MYVPYYFSIPKIIYMITNEDMILVQVDDKLFTTMYIIFDFFSRKFDLFQLFINILQSYMCWKLMHKWWNSFTTLFIQLVREG